MPLPDECDLINKIEMVALTEFNRTLLEDYCIHIYFNSFYEINKLSDEERLKLDFKDFIISVAKNIIYKSVEKLTGKEYDVIMHHLNIIEIITTKECDVKLALVQKFIYNRIRE